MVSGTKWDLALPHQKTCLGEGRLCLGREAILYFPALDVDHGPRPVLAGPWGGDSGEDHDSPSSSTDLSPGNNQMFLG